jgi:hypothetical protein
MQNNKNALVAALGHEVCWVDWKLVNVNGRLTKVPYYSKNKKASTTNPDTWMTYDEARALVDEAKNGLAGTGIIFTPSQMLLGIDIDHVLEEQDLLPEWKVQIELLIEKANTYTEISPSGTGLHLYLKLSEPLDLVANRKAPFEAYTSGRFFTVTEVPYGTEKPLRTVTAKEALSILSCIGYPWGKGESSLPVANNKNPQLPSLLRADAIVLEQMLASKNGDEIGILYRGDISKYDNDESRADMALCAHLAFWTRKDPVQMERMWLVSGLGARQKTQNRKDYRDRTITTAIDGCKEVYSLKTTKKEYDFIIKEGEISDPEENLNRYKIMLSEIPQDIEPSRIVTSLAPLLEDLATTTSLLEGEFFIRHSIKKHFTLIGKDVDSLTKSLKEIRNKLPVQEVKREQRKRIATCPVPDKPVHFEEWAKTISDNFPDLRFASEVSLSVLSQFLIKDIVNPFALVLVDVPSSGKTITINFFDNIPELTYATDKFTPASFVSNAANVSKEELADIDLLPRLQYRMFMIRDLATIFSKRDDLNEVLGLLTRVLDGEGLNTDSGVHGQRQYSGEYLFMILAASTPIPPRVMKTMGTLGSRLFFLKMNSRTKDESELASQIMDQSYKDKEKLCRSITRDFLYTLWNKHTEAIDWDRKSEDRDLLLVIGRCSKLLAHLRGVIQIWQDDFNNSDYKYGTPVIEKPDRLNQLFYNLARGHAVVKGRNKVVIEDLAAIIDLCVDGAPSARASLFKLLIEAGGTMSTSEIEQQLTVSKPTALREMKTLEILGVCSQTEHSQRDNEISLSEDFRWFLSDECRSIQSTRESIK